MKKKLIIIAAFCFIFFFVFSRFVRSGGMKQLDFDITVKIQERIDNSSHLRTAAFVDNSMDGATFLASPLISSIVILGITLFMLIDIRKKKINVKAFIIPALFLLMTAAEIYGKTVVHHPSPPFGFIKHSISVFPKDYINEQFSYPSGHAARAVFVALCIVGLMIHMPVFLSDTRKIIGLIFLVGYVTLVCVSRIFLGHHWMSDIVGGVLLGGGSGLLLLGIVY